MTEVLAVRTKAGDDWLLQVTVCAAFRGEILSLRGSAKRTVFVSSF